MEINQTIRDAIVRHALDEDPNECCGLVSIKDEQLIAHYRMTNVEHSPYRYSMDGKELLIRNREIEDAGCEIGIIYHSHTHSPAYPSDTDIRLATWPNARYLLVSLIDKDNPDLRIFSIVDGEVTEESITTTS